MTTSFPSPQVMKFTNGKLATKFFSFILIPIGVGGSAMENGKSVQKHSKTKLKRVAGRGGDTVRSSSTKPHIEPRQYD